MFLNHRLEARKFCVLKCTFGSGRLLLTPHNQLLESLHEVMRTSCLPGNG